MKDGGGGEAPAFERLLREHARAMFLLADFVLHDRGAAEDATQEAFVIAWKRRDSLKDAAAFVPWLRRIVLRECFRWRRHRFFHVFGLGDQVVAVPQVDGAMRIDLARAMRRLSPALRAVVFLHFYEDLTLARIANDLEVPESTVKTRLYEALRRLEGLLPGYSTSESGDGA